MREYLFRGRRVDNGAWAKGYLRFHYVGGKNSEGFIYTGKSSIYSQEESTSHDVETSTVGQYTGVTDSNGTKVFEGDLMKCPTDWMRGIGTVNTVNGNACVCYASSDYLLSVAVKYDKVVIVGSIHDTPLSLDLLKQRSAKE